MSALALGPARRVVAMSRIVRRRRRHPSSDDRHGVRRQRRALRHRAWRVASRLGAAAGLLASVASCVPPPISGSDYELVFVDQFDGDALSGVWSVPPHGNPLAPSLVDGVMTIWTTTENRYSWGFVGSTGPRVATEPGYPFMHAWQEGYVEARIRYSDNPWAWPAFWMYSASTAEAWPGQDCRRLTSEWDIMENGIANQSADHGNVSVIHRNTTDGTADGYCNQLDETRVFQRGFPDVDLDDWHVWAGRWTGDELCTYLDDVELQCMDAYDTTAQPMHLVFTIQYLRACEGCGPRPGAMAMQVDWVRVWQTA